MALTERDYAILDFERSAWKSNDTKQRAIRKTFSISPARYYQLRDALIDKPEAVNRVKPPTIIIDTTRIIIKIIHNVIALWY